MLKLFYNRPAGDLLGPCGRPGAHGHHVGDPCYKVRKFAELPEHLRSEISFLRTCNIPTLILYIQDRP